MKTFANKSSLLKRSVLVATLSIFASGLTACYVVPLDHPVYAGQGTQAPRPNPILVPTAPTPLNFTARLYPVNESANVFGVLIASVTNELNGRGQFAVNIGGESFAGEATRANSSRDGIANGAGNRGSFIKCNYRMNSASQGTGRCEMSNGAAFNMHVGA